MRDNSEKNNEITCYQLHLQLCQSIRILASINGKFWSYIEENLEPTKYLKRKTRGED